MSRKELSCAERAAVALRAPWKLLSVVPVDFVSIARPVHELERFLSRTDYASADIWLLGSDGWELAFDGGP